MLHNTHQVSFYSPQTCKITSFLLLYHSSAGACLCNSNIPYYSLECNLTINLGQAFTWKIGYFIAKFYMHKTKCFHIRQWCLSISCTPERFNMCLFNWVRLSKLETNWTTTSFCCHFVFLFLTDMGICDEYMMRYFSKSITVNFFFNL